MTRNPRRRRGEGRHKCTQVHPACIYDTYLVLLTLVSPFRSRENKAEGNISKLMFFFHFFILSPKDSQHSTLSQLRPWTMNTTHGIKVRPWAHKGTTAEAIHSVFRTKKTQYFPFSGHQSRNIFRFPDIKVTVCSVFRTYKSQSYSMFRFSDIKPSILAYTNARPSVELIILEPENEYCTWHTQTPALQSNSPF